MTTNDLRQPSLLLYYAGTTIHDAETQRSYLQDPRMGAGNGTAGEWGMGLQLSELLEGESEPPDGRVGQYGRYGCVLMETFEGVMDSVTDVVLFPYEEDGLERFLKEIRQRTGTRFREAEVDPLDVNLLHTLSLVDPWDDEDEDDDEEGLGAAQQRVPGQPIKVESQYEAVFELWTEVYGAMAWGENMPSGWQHVPRSDRGEPSGEVLRVPVASGVPAVPVFRSGTLLNYRPLSEGGGGGRCNTVERDARDA